MTAAFELKIAQKQLNMSEHAYRANIAAVTGGKTSSKQLTRQEIKDVLAVFKRLGYKPTARPRDKQVKRISYLWLRLKEAGKLESGTRASMLKFCARFTGNSNTSSLYKAQPKQLSDCIEALQDWCQREGVKFNRSKRQ